MASPSAPLGSMLYPHITLEFSRYRSPPHPLALLLLVVEIRGPEQGLGDRPEKRVRMAITPLMKPGHDHVPTDCIRSQHLSFDAFCRRLKRETGIEWDRDRDELGWVVEPYRSKPRQLGAVLSEISFHNAISLLRLQTTQEEPPQELILHLWSPAPKEPIFRRPRRVANLPAPTHIGDPDSAVSAQQSSSIPSSPSIQLPLTASTQEASHTSLDPAPPASTTTPLPANTPPAC